MDIFINNAYIKDTFSLAQYLLGEYDSLTITYLIDSDLQEIEIKFNSVQRLPFVNGISLITK